MKVVLPIAGRGSRFLKEGITTPKPLISVLGKPMVQRAIESVPWVPHSDFIFIARRDHQEEHGLVTKLKKLLGDKITIIYTPDVTEGAACTVLLAKDYINFDEDILIMDTDHYFISDLEKQTKKRPKNLNGFILVFEDDDPKWSFTKIDKRGWVVEIAEKKPISKYANVGAYYFSHGRDFVWAAERMIKKGLKVNNEYYVAPVYNQMIERGDRLGISVVSQMWEMGTPADVEYFEKNFKE